jgi:hypothetical protein
VRACAPDVTHGKVSRPDDGHDRRLHELVRRARAIALLLAAGVEPWPSLLAARELFLAVSLLYVALVYSPRSIRQAIAKLLDAPSGCHHYTLSRHLSKRLPERLGRCLRLRLS